MKDALINLLRQSAEQLVIEGVIPENTPLDIRVDRCKDKSHGDLATNLAMATARACRIAPRQLAELLVGAIPDNDFIREIRIAGPGFINFFLNDTASAAVIRRIVDAGAQFGCNHRGQHKKIQVEFVSANPTGPLHVGHGRGAALGDCICRLLEANGWQVTREFYYNDAGAQITQLALSVQARCRGLDPTHPDWPADGYRGDYIVELAREYLTGATIDAEDRHVTSAADADDLDAIRDFAVAYLRREQDQDLRAFDVHFDVYALESSLYAEGKVEATVQRLIASGHSYQRDGALWLATSAFGDDKDRVMRKAQGGYTYFVPDVAYHAEKWRRGFSRVINEQGADHHSTVTRVRAGLQALDIGIPEHWPEYVLHQMVTVMRGGQEVKISKRAGSYVTLQDLTAEVGRDATRYFLAARAPSSQLTFDIDLARSQSNDNPVYYIQYAHARVCSLMRQLAQRQLRYDRASGLDNLHLLQADEERALLRRLDRYPDVVAQACDSSEPHQVANFLRSLAADFHAWYNNHKAIVDDAALRNGRLTLAQATGQVIRNGLDLLGVSAPESM